MDAQKTIDKMNMQKMEQTFSKPFNLASYNSKNAKVSALNKKDRENLDNFAEYVLDLKKKGKNIRIAIRAFTDASGSQADNEKVSTQRADNMKKYLESKGLKDPKIEILPVGLGGRTPLVEPATSLKNNRTQIEILPDKRR